MLTELIGRYLPAQLYRGPTIFPILSKLDEELRICTHAGAAAGVLDRFRSDFYSLLRKRFSAPAAQALVLKILNICLARFHLQARSVSLQSRPIGLVVDPSNMCQLACPGCVHSTRSEKLKLFDWNKGTLGEERFRTLLQRYGPYAVGVYFCNYGEPLLNRNTPTLVRWAKTYLLQTKLSTSLSVSQFDAEAYVESGLDGMILSIDGATQAVYERYRRGGNLELVFSNVRKLVEAKRRLGSRTPLLSWNFLAFRHNEHEIHLAENMARKLGINHFQVVNPFDVSWDDPEIQPASVKIRSLRLDWSSVVNRTERWNPPPESVDSAAIAQAFHRSWSDGLEGGAGGGSGHTCHWLYKNIVMDATGRILPCCCAPRPDANLVFSALEADGADDPFNSAKHREARSWFSNKTPVSPEAPYCTRCDWDHTRVNIGGPEIQHYFWTADSGLFDHRSRNILSDW